MFYFKLTFYDKDWTNKNETRQGIIAASTWVEAMQRIEDWYGRECIVSIDCMYEMEDLLEQDDVEDMFK